MKINSQLCISGGMFIYRVCKCSLQSNPQFKNRITTLPSETIYLQYDDDSTKEIYHKVMSMGSAANATTSNGDQCGYSTIYGQYSNG